MGTPRDREIADPADLGNGPLIGFAGVLALAWPVGRDMVMRRPLPDPRFPRPVMGGGASGVKRIYGRKPVERALDEIAVTGPLNGEQSAAFTIALGRLRGGAALPQVLAGITDPVVALAVRLHVDAQDTRVAA